MMDDRWAARWESSVNCNLCNGSFTPSRQYPPPPPSAFSLLPRLRNSVTRRGQPCWFRRPEVKLIAINDSFILESCVFKILKRYFGGEKYYSQLVDLFIEVTRQTELGQLLDLTSQPQGGVIDLNRFTLDRYKLIVKYKTAFYSFYLPIALGEPCLSTTI